MVGRSTRTTTARSVWRPSPPPILPSPNTVKRCDPPSHRYYFHAKTQRTTWTHPGRLSKNTSLVDVELVPGKHGVSADSAGASSKALPKGWEAIEDDEGNTYYYNEKENHTTWERPETV